MTDNLLLIFIAGYLIGTVFTLGMAVGALMARVMWHAKPEKENE